MVDGKSQEMSTKELFGGARIHYIFQSIFVKSLEVQLSSHKYLACSIACSCSAEICKFEVC